MKTSGDESRAQVIELTAELGEHLKILRDYATTPDNIWLARGELNRIQEKLAEVERLLALLKSGD